MTAFSTRQIADALYESGALRAERLEKIRRENELLSLEISERRGQLLDKAELARVMAEIAGAMLEIIRVWVSQFVTIWRYQLACKAALQADINDHHKRHGATKKDGVGH